MSWMNRATLDVIGLTGFGYNFNSLATAASGSQDELSAAFSVLFGGKRNPLDLLSVIFPLFRYIVSCFAHMLVALLN